MATASRSSSSGSADESSSGGRRGWRVAHSALLVTALTGASQLLGFVRDAVNAWAFGASSDYDAYLVAQGMMNLVLAMIASAMAKATVPTVARAAERRQPRLGVHSAQVGLTVAICVLVAGSALMWWGSPQIVALLAPGFDARTTATAIELTRIMVVASVFIAGTNILAAAAQAHRKFFAAGVQGVPFNLVMITAAVAFGGVFGVRAIAVGFVVGSFIRFVSQIPTARHLGMSLRPSFDLRDPGFREMRRLLPLLLVGSAVGNINTLVDRAVGSTVGAGVISALGYGYRLVQLPYALLVVTLATVLYPSLGAVSLPEQRAELRRLVHHGISMLIVLLAPIVAILITVGRYLVIAVFARGDFTRPAIDKTTIAVSCFAVGLFGLGIREVLARTAYSLGDARAPVGSTIVGIAVNVVGDLLLGPTLGVAGIAVSTAVSLLVAAGLLALRMRGRHDAVRPRQLTPVAGVAVGSALVAAFAGLGTLAAISETFHPGDTPGLWTACAIGATTTLCIVVVYVVLLRAAHRPELREITMLAHSGLSRLRH